MTEAEKHLTDNISRLESTLARRVAEQAAAEQVVEGLMYDLGEDLMPVDPVALEAARAEVSRLRAVVLDIQGELGTYRHRLTEETARLDTPWTK